MIGRTVGLVATAMLVARVGAAQPPAWQAPSVQIAATAPQTRAVPSVETGPAAPIADLARSAPLDPAAPITDLARFAPLDPAAPAHQSPAPTPGQDATTPDPAVPRVRIGGIWYLAFQAGEENDRPFSRFGIKRGYLNVEADILPYLSGRITPDIYYDDDGVEMRLKYAFARVKGQGGRFVSSPELQFGIVQVPWLDFEEHVNRYRLQDTMFVERAALFNSGDFGVTFVGNLGESLPEAARLASGNHHPGRWGSFAVGIYNGGGYAALEANQNKVVEARLTLRPLPDVAPGLQVSYSLVRGKGNTVREPEWHKDLVFASWEHPRGVVTEQWVSGDGNQSGDMVDTVTGRAMSHRGWSMFGEGRLGAAWSVIGRVERFKPDIRVPERWKTRTIVGVARHLSRNNMLLVDADLVSHGVAGRPRDLRGQVVLQIGF